MKLGEIWQKLLHSVGSSCSAPDRTFYSFSVIIISIMSEDTDTHSLLWHALAYTTCESRFQMHSLECLCVHPAYSEELTLSRACTMQ